MAWTKNNGVKGDKGDPGAGNGTVTQLNDVLPNGEGKLTVTPSDVGAAPLDHNQPISSITGLQNTLDSKASKTQEPWKPAILQNGWSGWFYYRKNDIGQLEISYGLKAGTVGALTHIASLPTEYRPSGTVVLNPLANASGGRVDASFYINIVGSLYVANSSTFVTGADYMGTAVAPIGGI